MSLNMRNVALCIVITTSMTFTSHIYAGHIKNLLPTGKWKLVFSDEFDNDDSFLDDKWSFQNGTANNINSSRWRENVVVKDGTAKLLVKKEYKGGKEWTTANMWTKETFNKGYFECRYRYAHGTGLNNSFWIATKNRVMRTKNANPDGEFEIDINEGHYPNKINMSGHYGFGKEQTFPTKHIYTNKDASQEYIVIGFHWSDNYLVWYVDGEEVQRITHDNIYNKDVVILLSLAVLKSNWAGVIANDSDGSAMIVDYVRVYSEEQ